MNPPPTPNPYKRARFPVEMLGHGAWLYRTRLPQRRDGEELMAEGGVILTDEVVRYWCRTCGQADVHQLWRRRLPLKNSPRRRSGGEARMAVDEIGVTLMDQNFQTVVLESPQPVLVGFAAEGCGPWHLLAPEIAAIEEAFRGRVTVATLDVEA
jgi:Thioredoxin